MDKQKKRTNFAGENVSYMIRYTKAEEIWNAWSHAAGIALGVVVGGIFLVICYRGDNSWARAGVIL